MMSMKQYQMILKAKNRGLTINEIARSLGHDRKTVRKYYRMDNEEYLRYRGNAAERGKAFAEYRDEILEIYRTHPDRPVYSSGMYDYLLERHGPLPGSERIEKLHDVCDEEKRCPCCGKLRPYIGEDRRLGAHTTGVSSGLRIAGTQSARPRSA